MKKYTIISIDELIKLIKFGTIYQGINYIFDEKNKNLKIEELLKALPYDDELGFLIIEFIYDDTSSFDSIQTLIELDIKNIISIYCLSNQALNFYKTKFNPNIKFKLFENLKLIEDITKYKVIEDKNKGVKALSEIFKIDLKINQGKLDEEYIQELLDYKDIGYLEQDFRSFYHDMFCYERKNSFFKEDIGFLSDVRALNKMENIRKNKSIFLSGNYTDGIISGREKNAIKLSLFEIIKKYIFNKNGNEKENIIVSSIFLKSKNLLDPEKKEKNYWDEFFNLINEFKNDHPEETKIALWYIGVFLGYKYLYDDYYKYLDLNIFKEDSTFGNNANIMKETNPVELELEKVKSENKEVQELENNNAEVCVPKEIEKNLINDTSDVAKEEVQKISELKKQLAEKEENETELHNKISELQKQIESIPKIESQIQEEQVINSEIKTLLQNNSQLTNDEIAIFSLSHLQEIAKKRKVETPTSKKYSKTPEGKILLWQEIIKSKGLF